MINTSQFSYEILVNQKPIRQFAHKGNCYIEARNGAEYTIKIKNNTFNRILAITSVDSLNVIDGQVNSEAGYIINGHSPLEIKGFRVDSNTVNSFKFVTKDKSYAAKSEETGGNTQNCGVIGFRILSEKINPIPQIVEKHIHHYEKHPFSPYIPRTPVYPWNEPWITWVSTTNANYEAGNNQLRCYNHSISSSNIQEGSLGEQDSFNMGTEFSNKTINSSITEVEFKKGSILETFEIFYTNIDGLISLGVPINKQNEVVFPQSFPKFCKPPKN